MSRRTTSGVTLVLLLLFSCVLVFEVKLPKANAALFSDDFSNLSSWTVVNGVWTSAEGVLQGTSAVGWDGLIWAGNTAWTNYRVTANVRAVISEAGVVVRYNGPMDFYWLGLGAWGHKYSISKVVNNVYQELASSGLASEVDVGRWYLVSAVAFGNMLQLFVDGVKVLEVQDSSLSNGAIGLMNWNGTMQAEYLTVQPMGWSKTFGEPGDGDVGNSVIQTSDGGYVIAGSNSSAGSGEADVYLVKTDSSGNIQWSKTYGTGIGTSIGESVVQTSNGYAIAGYTSVGASGYNVYLIKTDLSGNMQWSKTYGGTGNALGYSMVQTSDGGYAITGQINPNFNGGHYSGPVYVYLVKTDASGNMQWNKTYGGTSQSTSLPLHSGYSIVQTSDGGYAITGSNSSSSSAGADVYLVKTDSSGNMQWSKSYGGTGMSIGESVVQTSDGYAIAGCTTLGAGGWDVYLVKTDLSGNMQWNKTYGGTGDDEGRSIVQTSDGYAIAGFTFSFGAGNDDVYLVKTDSVGNMQWSKTYGGIGYDLGYSMVQTSDGGYAITGYTSSFGADGSVYLVKVPPDEPPFTVDNYNRLWHTSDFTITLTASDDEFTSVSDTYYRINDGSIKSVSSNGQPVISTEGTNNKLEYWSVDSLGHLELPHNILTGIKLDKTAPSGSIDINNGDASTSSTSVTLSLTYADATSGVSQVRYSNDGVWDTESWESATASKPWTLTAGDGSKTVYFQIKDNAGLLSLTYSDTIGLEIPTPTPTPTATPTPTPTPSPSPTPTVTPSPSPSPSPSPTPTPTLTITSTPTASPTPIPTPTPTPSPTETPATATPSPSQPTSPSPTPLAQFTATPLYLYAAAVLAILVISLTALIIRKRGLQKY